MAKVSVCCSVLNQSEWLKEMIQSVVNQTFKDWELVLVDDGSTEDIQAVVESFNDQRIKLTVFPKNLGIPHGINWAFQHCDGEYVQALAADEVLIDTKLADQVDYLDEHPEVDCVWGLPQFCSNMECKEPGKRPLWEQALFKACNRSKESWLKTLLLLDSVPLGTCSALWRKTVFDSIGYFDEQLTSFVDHEWYCRFFKKHVGTVLPYRWAICKPNPNSVQINAGKKNAEQLEYVRKKHQLILPPQTGKVTIGIPVFNMAKYVSEAIRSAMNQTYKDLEILVLNDGSTDNLNEIMTGFTDPRIKYMAFDENRGQMQAQNQMLARAEGEFFVPLSADDTLDPSYVEKCLAAFKANPFSEFVASQTNFMDESGNAIISGHPFLTIEKASNKTQDQWKERLRFGNVYFGAGMFRTYAAREVQGWEPQYEVISDYQIYLKLLQRENIIIVEEPLTHTRITGQNQSLLNPDKAMKLKQWYHDAKKDYYPPRAKLIIATPFYELKGFSPYISSMVQTVKMLTQMGLDFEFWELSGDSYVHRARNTICAKFLEDPDATDLFFIDSDMQWNPEALINMVHLPEGVVGGSYPTKNAWNQWTSIPIFEKGEDGKNHPRGRILPDGTALILGHVVAGGFLRIKRQALLQYQEHYKDFRYKEPAADPSAPTRVYTEFFATQRDGEFLYGEDMLFSKRLRDMGMEMWIYPNVNMGHFGIKGWMGNYHQFLQGKGKEQDPFIERIH